MNREALLNTSILFIQYIHLIYYYNTKVFTTTICFSKSNIVFYIITGGCPLVPSLVLPPIFENKD